MKSLRHIVAIGGAGFSIRPDKLLLEQYDVLALTRKRKPRICFIGTASGDSPDYIARFHMAARRLRFEPSVLRLFARDATTPRNLLLSQGAIYVGGGNTANMLAIWRVHGVDKILREAWRRGIVLTGVSAGMLCWFEGGITDSFRPLAPLKDGLGFLCGTACPHYDGEVHRRPSYHRFLRKGLSGGYAADDGTAMHFIGRKLHGCISSRPRARCYRVEGRGSRVIETVLPTRFLGETLRKTAR